jgi:methyl-accepting chemotaxis protein
MPQSEFFATADAIRNLIILIALVAMICAFGAFPLLACSIYIPLNVAVAFLGVVASGDISQDLPQKYMAMKDEIGDLAQVITRMEDSLRKIVGSVQTAAKQVATEQNASVSEEMASLAEELSGQAAQLSETMSFFKLATQVLANANAESAPGGKPEGRGAHSGAGNAADKAAPAASRLSTASAPAKTAITLTKRGGAADSDFEQF